MGCNMPNLGTQNTFLGPTQQIETCSTQVIIFHAKFTPDLFEDQLFSNYDIQMPPSLNTAVDKRKSEYLAGRALVARAFKHLNIPAQNIPSGAKREPIWPAGVQGSITHSRGHCACILTTATDQYVGIDIESLLNENALRSVRRIAMHQNDETTLVSQTAFTDQHIATLLFSAKETLYKTLFPIVQSFFGFDAATIHETPSKHQIQLRLTRTLHPTLQEGLVFTLNHQQLDDKILTWLVYQHHEISGA